MIDTQLALYLAIGLGFVAFVAVGFAFAGGGSASTAQLKRVKAVAGGGSRSRLVDGNAVRRKQMENTIKGLKAKEIARKKQVVGRTIQDKLKQAGLTTTPTVFWIASVICGLAAGAGILFAGFQPLIAVAATFAAGLGLPRWFLGMLITTRQKKFVSQFADAIDIIVRGVKAGLPLNECLRIIASESPQPLRGEFERLVDGLSMGQTMEQALARFYSRTPVQEVNFFNIVLNIQSKAGGNLSEALGNLSTVLRSRKLLREKIKALSSEAKASAVIIGSLPPTVILLVYLTTPEYIMTLFTHDIGHMILLISVGLMGIGIYIMRQMINFDF